MKDVTQITLEEFNTAKVGSGIIDIFGKKWEFKSDLITKDNKPPTRLVKIPHHGSDHLWYNPEGPHIMTGMGVVLELNGPKVKLVD